MTIPEAIGTLTDAVDDVYWRDEYQPITEGDAFLQRIVHEADLPSLLVALAAVTGDFQILRPGLRPSFPPTDVVPAPHGGLGVEAQAEARDVALTALKRVRDDRLTTPRRLDAAETRILLDFLTNGASDADTELLTHELDLAPKKLGAPDWTFEEVSQGREFKVAVIGTGMSGIAAMYRLSQAGVPFTAFEKNPDVGGVWWANTYPGARLDTPTFAYSYSFAQRADWPSAYARGEEIEEYALEIVERAGLRKHVVFDTEVTALTWDEERGDWEVVTRSGGTDTVQRFNAVISAVGQLERPNIPEYPGRGDFRGAQMHSARWDHGVDLAGKRVAVIGTGASAYQIVPAIVDRVAQLTVFQRSGPWMVPAPNYHDATPSALSWLCEHVPYYGQWFRLSGFFQSATGRAHTVIAAAGWEREDSVSPVNLKVRQILTEVIGAQWKDHPELLATVVPNYPPGAKRMLRDNGVWAQALQRPHAQIVTSGIDHFTENGITTADGDFHEFDVIIYATGFLASDFLDPIEVRGATGQTLKEHWQGDARAWAGISVPGYPNLFIVMGPNTNYVVHGSQHFMMECGVEFAVEAIHQTLLRGVKGFDVRQSALEDIVGKVDAANATRAWGRPQVRSWYKNRHGRVSQIWPFSHLEYWRLTHEVDFDRDFTVRH
ncbi:monooxygenase [Sinomonas cellulolyticus]|uniref:NAD(P)/FAD-dependent oxidoreductase n=1 Tax=Sinomonas cellulolyticus TaxID=2801916 RepID=A0ABS1K6A6_9MICC|nr:MULTISPECIES: NAD(P)/FAD-dependent oxidoreductase [Sinomonas]MBL0707204.1 NAD(P)/FAD-dependent oxidoreductase [Sinomonas cellulolyticus]GHG50012.1 monooxygenase [Sinomonas sp. KCTC 49339]